MESVKSKVLKVLDSRKMCYVATQGRGFVDNAMVAYWSEGFNLYFGSYADTLKNRNLNANPSIAVCVENVQIHGIAEKLERGSREFWQYVDKYCEKFPTYRFYFEHSTNEYFRVKPLVIWIYDVTSEGVKREKIVFDEAYDKLLTEGTK